LSEYLSFRKLITPMLVQVLFWFAIASNTISALFYSDSFLEGVFLLFGGPIVIRIVCEAVIVAFEINNTLTEIRDNQRLAQTMMGQTTTAPPTVSTMPAK
jgi:hypothetical protein